MKRKTVKWFGCVLCCLCLLAICIGCNSEVQEPEVVCTISYKTDIEWIIDVACAQAGCHHNNSVNGDFTAYEGVKQKVDNGSLWFRVLVTRDMPPSITLDSTQLDVIKVWIEEGAKDN